MIPTAYEFQWDLGHIVFLGIFYGVLAVVVVALGVVAHHWLRDLEQRRAPAIAWQETFHELPGDRRHCRHEFRGTVSCRICDHGFDCPTCLQHRVFEEAERRRDASAPASLPAGLDLPEHSYYHRGHTWVDVRDDGLLDVGLDDLAARCVGHPNQVVLPAAGSVLQPGDRVATLARGPFLARILAPVSGEVVATGDLSGGWLCRVRPAGPRPQLGHLLRGREAAVWMMREVESLQQFLSQDTAGPSLADGGEPVDDLFAAYPDADWDAIWSRVCLDV